MITVIPGFITLLFLILGVYSGNDEPTFEVPTKETSAMTYSISTRAFETMSDHYLPVLESTVLSSHIPDYKDTINSSIGKIDVEITNIEITIFDIGNMMVNINTQDNMIEGFVDDITLEMKFNYGYQQLSFPYKSESGYGVVSTVGLTLTCSVGGIWDPETGKIEIKLGDIIFNIGDLEIDMEGGVLADIVKALDSLFSDIINDMISASVTEFLMNFITPAIDYFNDIPFVACPHDLICVDLRLGADIIFEENGLRGYFGGTYYWFGHQDLYGTPEFNTLPEVPMSTMITVQFGKAAFDTYFDAMYVSATLDLLDPSTEKSGPVVLYYDDIISYFPQWSQQYPSGTNGNLYLRIIDNPSAEIMYNGLRVILKAHVDLVPIGQADTTFISTDVTLTTLGDLAWRNYHHSTEPIVSDPDCLSIELSLVSFESENEIVDNSWLEMVINTNYLPCVNHSLWRAYIKMFDASGITYTNSVISYNGEYVVVSTDFEI